MCITASGCYRAYKTLQRCFVPIKELALDEVRAGTFCFPGMLLRCHLRCVIHRHSGGDCSRDTGIESSYFFKRKAQFGLEASFSSDIVAPAFCSRFLNFIKSRG